MRCWDTDSLTEDTSRILSRFLKAKNTAYGVYAVINSTFSTDTYVSPCTRRWTHPEARSQITQIVSEGIVFTYMCVYVDSRLFYIVCVCMCLCKDICKLSCLLGIKNLDAIIKHFMKMSYTHIHAYTYIHTYKHVRNDLGLKPHHKHILYIHTHTHTYTHTYTNLHACIQAYWNTRGQQH